MGSYVYRKDAEGGYDYWNPLPGGTNWNYGNLGLYGGIHLGFFEWGGTQAGTPYVQRNDVEYYPNP